jgi:hypothetical protein
MEPVNVKFDPDHFFVYSDVTQALNCAAGRSGIERDITYYIYDGSNAQNSTQISLKEQFDSKNPADGTTTCNGQTVNSTETCTPGFVGTLVDHLSAGCSDDATTPPGCGQTWTNQQWIWCSVGAPVNAVVAHIGDLVVHKDQVVVNGNNSFFQFATTFDKNGQHPPN